MPSAAYRDLARFLVGRHRRDLLMPLASAKAAHARAARLVGVAQRLADAAAATRLRAEALRQRASFEHALHRAIEAISDMDDGCGLVDGLLGDDDRLLADRLLDDDDG
jgi:hypothetical protein